MIYSLIIYSDKWNHVIDDLQFNARFPNEIGRMAKNILSHVNREDYNAAAFALAKLRVIASTFISSPSWTQTEKRFIGEMMDRAKSAIVNYRNYLRKKEGD